MNKRSPRATPLSDTKTGCDSSNTRDRTNGNTEDILKSSKQLGHFVKSLQINLLKFSSEDAMYLNQDKFSSEKYKIYSTYMVEHRTRGKKNKKKNNVLLPIAPICKVDDLLDKHEFSGFKCI